MQRDSKGIQYLVGNESIFDDIWNVPVLPLFSDRAVGFFAQLSKRLMHSRIARRFPDVISYAFWIRKGNMEASKRNYSDGTQRIGRGVAFQITPSNIPVQFAVSMTYAMLSGNASVIRVSDKEFEQTKIICDEITQVLNDTYADISKYICIIKYGHSEEITRILSSKCDVRMIWGGNNTVASIRRSPISARCIDLGFADRYSIAVFDADGLLKKDVAVVASDFYNDTYFVDQNACSSPRMVIWIGNEVEKARDLFWKMLGEIVEKKYEMNPIASSDKLLTSAVFSAGHPKSVQIKKDNLLVRMEVSELQKDIMEYKGSCGYFFEYIADNLEEIVPLLKKECQTIVYIGEVEEKIISLIRKYGVRGVDRIVPVGHGTDISFVWDGIDLPRVLSRQIGDA